MVDLNDALLRIHRLVETDRRLRAAWLEGSLGRGDADRYSDIDLHLLLLPADLPAFQAQAEAWLAELQPLVLFKPLFDGRMLNALTVDGLRLDVWLHTDEAVSLPPGRFRLLYDPHSLVRGDGVSAPPDAERTAAELEAQIAEFWRCIALLPTVVARRERIVAFQGLNVELALLIEILLKGLRFERDAGVKKLNAFLPGELRRALEGSLSLRGLDSRSLVRSHLALAALLQEHGPPIAADHGFAYPAELERAVLRYVEAELASLDLAPDETTGGGG